MIAQVNGISLYYEVVGNGRPLILLHGNGEDHHIFDVLAEKLAAHFTVYAVDSRNHGQSEKTDLYSYETMAEDIYELIRVMHLAPVNIAGFSDGAIIGLMLALSHPECLEKAALLGVNLKPEDLTEESRRFIEEMYDKTGDPLFRLMLEEPNIDLQTLRSVTLPILLTAGEEDLFNPSLYTDLMHTLPNASLKIMSGHDHGSYVIHTDLLFSDLKDFFEPL